MLISFFHFIKQKKTINPDHQRKCALGDQAVGPAVILPFTISQPIHAHLMSPAARLMICSNTAVAQLDQ